MMNTPASLGRPFVPDTLINNKKPCTFKKNHREVLEMKKTYARTGDDGGGVFACRGRPRPRKS